MSSRAGFLRALPYFAALGDAEIERLEGDLRERSLEKGEVLFLEGEPCPGLYIVASGRVRIFKSSPEGREQVLLIAGPGDTFNDVPVFDGGPSPASALALEPSRVIIVPAETLFSLLAACPVARDIIRAFAARLRHLTQLVEDLSFRSVVSRLARALLDLAVAEGGPSPIPRLTQEEMAARVGSVRDVIGRALKALEKAGAVRLEGQRLLVVDRKKLEGML